MSDDLAYRPPDLEGDDHIGISLALVRAIRRGPSKEALLAFMIWFGATPGASKCEQIRWLKRAAKGPAIIDGEKVSTANILARLNILAWWWEHCALLHDLKITKPTLVCVGVDRAMLHEEEPPKTSDKIMFIAQGRALYRVEPRTALTPQPEGETE